jgi:hypothetical protein
LFQPTLPTTGTSQEGRVIRIEDEVRIGQDVSLRVLSTQGKLTLSMKPPATGTSEALVMGDLWFFLGKCWENMA